MEKTRNSLHPKKEHDQQFGTYDTKMMYVVLIEPGTTILDLEVRVGRCHCVDSESNLAAALARVPARSIIRGW